MRWRYGDTNPVMLPVLSSTEIEIGDLIYLDTDNAKPASSAFDQGTLEINQTYFREEFVGIAMQASIAGDVASIRIATSGVFEFVCDTSTFELGDLIGPTENAAANALVNQKVESVNTTSFALGRCAKRVDPASSRVLIDIVSQIMKGGVQAAV